MTRRNQFEVPQGAQESSCRSCKAPIAWTRTGERADGTPRWMPLDLSSVELGLDGRKFALSHFALCPNAKDHRRGRAVRQRGSVR